MDLDRLIDSPRARAGSSSAVLLAGLAPRPLGLALRSTLRERSRLTLATPPQLLDEFFQLLDLASLLDKLLSLPGKLPPELRVLLKEFLVSLHLYRRLQHTFGERTSSCPAYSQNPPAAGQSARGKAVNRYVLS
ncbi:MAG TPA: hypothetical protein VH988_12650 [Thermoanaerobaculia bacterium]|nr:hypothetical protein [Thermoanaerobaculia bacterium]